MPTDLPQSAYTLLGLNDVVAESNIGFLQKDGGEFTDARITVENFLDEMLRLRTGGAVALGTTSPLAITQAAASSGSPIALAVTGGAHTTLTASTEAIDAHFNFARTVQFAAGTLALQRSVVLKAPTLAFVSSSTCTAAATFCVDGPVAAGTNAAITDSYAMLVRAGAVGSGVTRSYGLAVFSATGATTNYGAYIEGSVGIGITTPQAKLDVRSGNCLKLTQVASTSGTAGVAFAISIAAHTGLTAGSECLHTNVNGSAGTTWAAGTLALQRFNIIQAGSVAFASASTATEVATQAITGATAASTNATITRSSGLLIQSNAVGAGVTTSYGLRCLAQTGATTNLSAYFDSLVGINQESPAATLDITSVGANALRVVQSARSSGTPNAVTFTGGAHTALTSAEATFLTVNAGQTVQFATGTLAMQRSTVFAAPTYAFVGASALTEAATVAINGAPAAGTNATTGASSGLLIQAGAVGAGVTASYGLTVNAQTGGTANYAARFIGGNVGVATSTPAYTLDVNGTINGTYLRSAAAAIGSVGFGNVNYASDATYYAVKQDGNARTTINGANSAAGGIVLSYDNGFNGAGEVMRAIQGSVTFNELGGDRDFRIEGDTNANLFSLDAGLDAIGIGAAAISSAFLALAAGTTAKAPLNIGSGTNKTTAAPGDVEFNGTNLFFTREGTTRETVITASAVTSETVTADRTLTINYNGNVYKLQAQFIS